MLPLKNLFAEEPELMMLTAVLIQLCVVGMAPGVSVTLVMTVFGIAGECRGKMITPLTLHIQC